MPDITWITPVAVVLLLWALLRMLPAGADGRAPLPYLISLGHLLWIPLVIVAIVALASDDVVSAVMATTAAAAIGGISLRTYHPRHQRAHPSVGGTAIEQWARPRSATPHAPASGAPASGATLTVMTLNCRTGRVDAHSVVQAVQEREVDVLALQELTVDAVAALKDAGMDDILPFHQLGGQHPDDNGGFNAIWSAQKPVGACADTVSIPAAEAPSLSLRLGPSIVRFVSAHTKSPQRGCREWSQGIIGLGALASDGFADHQTHPATADTTTMRMDTVLMGDLNSSPDHPSFRALLAQGFHDAGLSLAHGPVASFPSWALWPRIDIDHILFTEGIQSTASTSFTVPGTDHLAVCATLLIETGTSSPGSCRVNPLDSPGLALSGR